MATTAKAGGTKTERKLAPEGTHIARCIGVIDLGHQSGTDMKGNPVQQHKVRISWELPEETVVFKDDEGPSPFVVSKEYTLSLHEKSNLRAHLEAWRGRRFTDEELKGFAVQKLLGVPAAVSIQHVPFKDGSGSFAKITAVAKPMKGVVCPEQVMETLHYEVEDGRGGVFSKLPEWLQEKIAGCSEFSALGAAQDAEADEPAPF